MGKIGKMRRRVQRATAIVVAAGFAACALSSCSGGPAPSSTVAVDTGTRPNQDVVALPTDRASAITAALTLLPSQIDEALRRSKVPGLAVAVVSHDEVLYTNGFGVRDESTGAKVDADTVFQIASLSKPISATILAKAMTQDPSLTWSTPAHTLMPGLALADPYVTQNITVGDFFAHRSGIPTGGGDDLEDLGFDRNYILSHLREIPLQPFRTTYQYSNFGLTTGAEAVAASRGQSWEQMSKELLFSPLGMTSTSTSHADFLAAPNHAVLHARIGEDDFQPLFDRDPDAEAPAGGVSSNVRDLATWMQLLLSDGSHDGSAFINSAPLNKALSAQIVSSHPGDLDQRPGHYGFGINVGSAAGGRVTLSHSGAFGLGAATAATLVPDLDLGIVVLTNGAPVGLPEAVVQIFLDEVMYGHQSRDWIDTMHGFFADFNAPSGDLAGQSPPTDAAASAPASDYVGTYTSAYFGTLTVTEAGGRLRGALGPTGATTFDITPWNGDTMAYVPTGENALPGSLSSLVFARSGGTVTTATLTYLNRYPHIAEPSGLGVFTRQR